MAVTRRKLIDGMARIGGAGAAFEAMSALGLLAAAPAPAQRLNLSPDAGATSTVAILGAGLSGLCAAYELDRAGYRCIVLEAARRAGGRSLTLRHGDSFQEVGDSPVQLCQFDAGLHLNAGPGRISHNHTALLDYCRRFGVVLQPYIFAGRSNLIEYDAASDAKPVQAGQAFFSLQGEVAALLDKCVDRSALDLPLTGEDVRKLHDMLVQFGDLTAMETAGRITDWTYLNASGRAGYAVEPGDASQPGKPLTPLALDTLLRSGLWDSGLFNDLHYVWQSVLLEPTGGMDKIVAAFRQQPLARQAGTIDGLIRYGARVTRIEVGGDNVTIGYDEDGGSRSLQADYCISTIPMPLFKALRTNLDSRFMAAARDLPQSAAGKVGWQSERFWEYRDNIYGGISWTDDLITQIWYPSDGFLGAKGVLTGAYNHAAMAEAFNAHPVAERLEMARRQGEKLHPGYASFVEHGLAIAWEKMEFAGAGWAVPSRSGNFERAVRVLATPQGRLHLAGDQVTWWAGWQEGAIIAAREAVRAVDQQARAAKGG